MKKHLMRESQKHPQISANAQTKSENKKKSELLNILFLVVFTWKYQEEHVKSMDSNLML